jgi:hypothetical protein
MDSYKERKTAMTATSQQVKSSKNPSETIIDNTAKEPFISPLQRYVANNCQHCEFWKVKCRLEDSRGLTPMTLCIMLYTNQPPLEQMRGLLRNMEEKTSKIAEKTLQEANAEVE